MPIFVNPHALVGQWETICGLRIRSSDYLTSRIRNGTRNQRAPNAINSTLLQFPLFDLAGYALSALGRPFQAQPCHIEETEAAQHLVHHRR